MTPVLLAALISAASGSAAEAPKRLVLPDPRVSFAPSYSRIVEDRSSPSPTAVERQLAGGSVVGSLGYLCGVNHFAPGSNEGGPGSSYGRGTTFLGAKLSLPFK